MGTKHLVCVWSEGEFKVAQYGGSDGQPDVAGRDVYYFVRTWDMLEFRNTVRNLKQLAPTLSQEQAAQFSHLRRPWAQLSQPARHSSTGAFVLPLIAAKLVTEVSLEWRFGHNGMDCEWAYVVDLDQDTLYVYRGGYSWSRKSQYNHGPFSRGMPKAKRPEHGYAPVVLQAWFNFRELRTTPWRQFQTDCLRSRAGRRGGRDGQTNRPLLMASSLTTDANAED